MSRSAIAAALPACAAETGRRVRLRLTVRGAVQGVGFRPYVYRLATALGLAGFVHNGPQGVTVEVEGEPAQVAEFRRRLPLERPPRAALHGLEAAQLDPLGFEGFAIRPSDETGARSALVPPDVATCPDCLRECLDPQDRRHRYPFTNCTNCGPRYTIVLDLPYDRARTTMGRFRMCGRCQAEYEDPADRRFHAEPNACPECGPRLELWDRAGRVLGARDEALRAAAQALRDGRVVAVKGLGGFHLMVDARDETAVRALRLRKRREMKPLALMAGSLAAARTLVETGALEAALLVSPEAPIVLARRVASAAQVAPSVAPDNPWLGVMLPATPLHHLLLAETGFPVVATSGNLKDEPICTDEHEALERLGTLADAFLVHDRPIARRVDDSLVRLVAGRELLLRRARGYAPLPIPAGRPLPPLVGVGAHLKNTVAVAVGGDVFVSPHVGDLESEPALRSFRATVAGLRGLYGLEPEALACDAHPDYLSTQYARASGRPVVSVQHHYAHVLAAMADNELSPPVLGIAWDGSGFGTDGTAWGGEALVVGETGFERAAWLRTFPLPGGDRAAREPRRSALGLLHELLGPAAFEASPAPALFTPREREVLRRMLERGLNCPRTSSVGRLFDAVAALLGLHPVAGFEGQAAMALEFALDGLSGDEAYDLPLVAAGAGAPGLRLDWAPLVRQLLADVGRGSGRARVSLRFHNALARSIVAVAERVGLERVALSGGCFQNRELTERAVAGLRAAGFRPYWHQRLPPNDGGLAVGQVLAAARVLRKEV